MIKKEKSDLIRELYKEHKNYSLIGKMLNIPRMTVMRIVKRVDSIEKGKRGPLSSITNRDSTLIKKLVRKGNQEKRKVTARLVQNECNLNHISTRTIQRHLSKIGIVYKKIKKQIKLTPKQKIARVEFIKKMAEQNIDWSKVVFSDEKRFCLDGNDNWSSYIDENREIYRDKRPNKGGGMMVWAMVTSDGLFFLLFWDANYKSIDYCNNIIDVIKPLLDDIFGEEQYFFQHDGAAIHRSKVTTEHLKCIKMQILPYVAKSPDLNIIENMWAWMAEYVYTKKSHYDSLPELREAIEEAVEDINLNKRENIRNLYKSIASRHLKVIESKGDLINY